MLFEEHSDSALLNQFVLFDVDGLEVFYLHGLAVDVDEGGRVCLLSVEVYGEGAFALGESGSAVDESFQS